ncbi:MAG: DUF2510 domain-containing protein [Micropruina sp.]|nr:DUF2510 domain-containing protein [Micropruina sp.]
MVEAGWYPDPTGEPGRERYHDSQNWTTQQRRAPAAARPARTGLTRRWPVLVVAVVVALGGIALANRQATLELVNPPPTIQPSPPVTRSANPDQFGDRCRAGTEVYPLQKGPDISIPPLTMPRPGADWDVSSTLFPMSEAASRLTSPALEGEQDAPTTSIIVGRLNSRASRITLTEAVEEMLSCLIGPQPQPGLDISRRTLPKATHPVGIGSQESVLVEVLITSREAERTQKLRLLLLMVDTPGRRVFFLSISLATKLLRVKTDLILATFAVRE